MLDFSQSYFALFGIPEVFDVDLGLVAERHRSLLASVHPDRFAHAGEQERRLSMQASTHINEAREVLRSPLARARYLLKLRGVDLGGGSATNSDASFLMEQMELREALAEASDSDDPLATIAGLLDRIGARRREIESHLGGLIDGDRGLDGAEDLVQKLQFLSKVEADAVDLEARLEDEL